MSTQINSQAEADAYIKSINPKQIVQDSLPKIENTLMESAANNRAAREPLPGTVEDMFNVDPLTIKTSKGEVTIRPMVSYDINIFKLIGSPFYKILMGDITAEQGSSLFADEEDTYALIYQFTRPIKQVYNLFKKGKESYKDQVLDEIAFVYNPSEIVMLAETIMQHIFKVTMSRVGFEAPEKVEPQEDESQVNKLVVGDEVQKKTITGVTII